MTWDDECENNIRQTLSTIAHREVLYTTIAKLIDAKIHAALYHARLASANYDPDQLVDYQERLLAAVVDELFKYRP